MRRVGHLDCMALKYDTTRQWDIIEGDNPVFGADVRVLYDAYLRRVE